MWSISYLGTWSGEDAAKIIHLVWPRLKAVIYHQRSLHTRSLSPAGSESFMSQSMDGSRQSGRGKKTSPPGNAPKNTADFC